MPLPTALVAVHLVANVVWIGALLSVATLLSRAPWAADAADVGMLARRVHVSLAVPAFLGSFGAGIARIALAPAAYAHLPWFHAKLGLALIVIILHHVLGSRTKRAADGRADAGHGAAALGALAFMCATGAVLLGVAKSLP
jgi:putative membrane protein